MITEGGLEGDLAALVVPQSGRLVATGDRYEPYQLIDPGGAGGGPGTAYFRELLAAGSGPVINPFPLVRPGRGGRPHAHHNPMEPYRDERRGLYRPRVASRVPRSVPDSEFNEIFAALPSHRDRALVAFYVSTGARASELLSVTQAGADPGRQLISVVRKGSRVVQELPASTDAFVWLRLYQVEMAEA